MGATLLGTWLLARSMFSNETPNCAPSRDVTMSARRPVWLADAFDSAGIAATVSTPAPWWAWRQEPETPTFAFEATRQVGQIVVFAVLAAFGVYGAASMPKIIVNCLLATMAAVVIATCGIVWLMLKDTTDGIIEAFVVCCLVAFVVMSGAAAGGILAAAPILWGFVGALLRGLVGARALFKAQRSADPMCGKPSALQTQGDLQQHDDTDTEASSSDSECGDMNMPAIVPDWRSCEHFSEARAGVSA